jgi:hypothetical protein
MELGRGVGAAEILPVSLHFAKGFARREPFRFGRDDKSCVDENDWCG